MRPHVGGPAMGSAGPPADPMAATDGGCLFHGRSMADPRCTNPAIVHLMVRDTAYGVVGLSACAGHEWIARTAGRVLLEHPHEPVCGWPGSLWLRPENRCVLDDSGVRREHVMIRERNDVS